MTRVNVGIHPKELPSKLLLSEHREITRIPNAIKSGRAKLSEENILDTFRLGKGHVRFFYDKLLYLKKRYDDLLFECLQRGFQVTDKTTAFQGIQIDLIWWKDYVPKPIDRKIAIERIRERGFELLDMDNERILQ